MCLLYSVGSLTVLPSYIWAGIHPAHDRLLQADYYDLSVFVLDSPGNADAACAGINQASGSVPDPWAVLPLRGSHRAVLRRKSHYTVTVHRLIPEAVRYLQTDARSGRKAVLALIADVASHHRAVPDE